MMRIQVVILSISLALFSLGSRGAAAQQPEIKVGLASLSMFTIIYHLAKDKGFFERAGVNVEINHFESGSVNMKALLARAVDISDVETGLVLGAASNKADLRVIGTHSQRLHFGLYAKKDIKSLKDIYGRTFAISGVGGLPHLVILALLDRENLDASNIKMLTVGGTGARLSALAAGKIDATLGGYSPVIEAKPGLHRLMVISQELPDYIAQCLTVWADTLEKKGDALEKMVKGLVEATRWAYDNKDEFIKYAVTVLPPKTGDIGKIYDFYVVARVWAINSELNPKSLEYMQKLGIKMKTQAKEVDLAKIVDLSIYDKVTSEIGVREYPKQ